MINLSITEAGFDDPEFRELARRYYEMRFPGSGFVFVIVG